MEDIPDTTAEFSTVRKYRKIKDLNKGAHGVVVLAETVENGEKVAIKLIKRGPEMKNKYALREILNHRSLIHPHVVQFKEVFLTENCLAIVMEFCSGGDMLEYVVKRNGLPEASSRWFFQQLVLAVDYLHKMGFASRDIKLDNVLLDRSRRPLLKLCDFGYSKHVGDSVAGSIVGTPAYLAPEVIRADEATPYNPQLADIWCCGVFLYASTIGTYPFYRPQDRGDPKEVQIMIKRILNMQYKIPEGGDVSNELRDLLSKILVEDPKRRISLRNIMKHPWFIKDLPEGVLELNDDLPEPGDDVQSLAEIKRVMDQAASMPIKSPMNSMLRQSSPWGNEGNAGRDLSIIPESAHTSTSSERTIALSPPNLQEVSSNPEHPEPKIKQRMGIQDRPVSYQQVSSQPSGRMSSQPSGRTLEPSRSLRSSRRDVGQGGTEGKRVDKDPTVAAMRKHLQSIDQQHKLPARASLASSSSSSPRADEKSCLPCIRWNK